MKKALTMVAVFLVLAGWCGFALGGNLMSLPVEMQGRYGATHYIDISETAFNEYATNNIYTNTYPLPANTAFRFMAYELVSPFVGAPATGQALGDATITFGTVNSATAFLASTQIGTNSTTWWSAGVPAVSATKHTVTLNYAGATNPTVTVADKQITLNYAGATNPTVTLSLGTVLVTNVNWDTASGAASSNIFLMVTSATATATIPFGAVNVSTGATATATIPFGSVPVLTNLTALTAANETAYSVATNLMVVIAPASGQNLAHAQHGQVRLFFQKREAYGR